MGKHQVKNAYSIKNLLDLGGKYRDIELLRVKARKYTSDELEIKLLEKFFFLLVNTDYLEDEAYAFLVEGKSYRQIVEEYNIKYSTLKNKIHHNTKRVYEDLVEDPLALIRYPSEYVTKKEKEDAVDRLLDRIEVIIKNYTIVKIDNLLDYMLVDFSKYSERYDNKDGKIDSQEYEQFIKRMQYLSKPYLERIFQMVDKHILGYVTYLLTTSDRRLSERDLIKKKELCELWLFPTDQGYLDKR